MKVDASSATNVASVESELSLSPCVSVSTSCLLRLTSPFHTTRTKKNVAAMVNMPTRAEVKRNAMTSAPIIHIAKACR